MPAKRYVANYPGLGPDLLAPVANLKALPRWLPRSRTTLLPCARFGLYHGYRAMRLRPDDAVLVPAFVCNTVSGPLEKAGAKLAFFNVNEDLSIDWDHVRSLLRPNVKAMVWYHFLGLPAGFDDVIPFCRRHRLMLIEDCAHALFSEYRGRPVGSSGDFAVFSIRKSLPVLAAGALVVNNPRIRSNLRIRPAPIRPAVRHLLDELETVFYRLHFLARDPAAELVRKNIWALQQRSERLYRDLRSVHELDDTSRLVMHNTDPARVRRARHRNFALYLTRLRDLCPFKTLPHGAAPLGFPIVIDGRDKFRKRLKDAYGVDALTHWPVWLLPRGVKERFPAAVHLADRILTLPCHQDLSAREIEHVCRAVRALA